MNTIPLDSLIIKEDRQRQHYDVDKLSELSDSILVTGLLNPLVVYDHLNPTLIAGERRRRAIKLLYAKGHPIMHSGVQLPEGHVPVTYYHSEDEYAVELAELDENLHRADLTWQEKTAALARLHKIKVEQNPSQSASDTARQVWAGDYHSGAPAMVGEAMLLDRHMDNPEVAKAKSKKDALKIIRKSATNEILNGLARVHDDSNSEHTLIKGDCLEVMDELPSEYWQCIITDPPYGIGADTFGDQAIGDHQYEDSEEYFKDLLPAVCRSLYRISAAQSHAYVFCDPRRFDDLRLWMEAADWYTWPTPLIWYKGNMGLLPRPDHGPRRTYETILYAIKGDKKILKPGAHDVIHCPSVGSQRHAAEKPVDLYCDLLSRSVRPGDRVLDCFAGSGPLFPAANRMSLEATGIELDETAYALALSRLEEK